MNYTNKQPINKQPLNTQHINKQNREGNSCKDKAEGLCVRKSEYYAMLRSELEKHSDENVDITFREVRKNNGVCKNACTIRFNDAQVAPTIYLEPYYDHYLHGEAVSESAENIINYCRKKTPDTTFPDNFFYSYDSVRSRLGIKLIGTEANRGFLKGVPHVDLEDLSAVFYYLMEDPAFGNGMIIVKNTDIKRWGKNEQELYREVLENCAQMLPPVLRPLSEVLEVVCPETDGNLYLLTNETALFGAAVILYPGMLQEISRKIGGPYFILPSSVHELILLPDSGEEAEDLLSIVTEINHTQVAEEEILTDAVYKYVPGDDAFTKEA